MLQDSNHLHTRFLSFELVKTASFVGKIETACLHGAQGRQVTEGIASEPASPLEQAAETPCWFVLSSD